MEKKISKLRNKSTLIATVLIVTVATSLSAYATSDETNFSHAHKKDALFFNQELTAEQKAGLEQARTMFKSGNPEGAKALLDKLDLENLQWRFYMGPKMGGVMKNLTDEQKEGMKEIYQLLEEDKKDEAMALMKKLDIQLPPLITPKMLQALDAGSYEEWKKAISSINPNSKLLKAIDETKFQTMVKIHQAMQAGDFDTAKKLAKEAGFKAPFFREALHFMKNNLTDEEKAKLDQAHELIKNGEEEGARAIFKELNLPFPEKFIMKMSLSDEEKAELQKAKSLIKEGNKEEAKAIFDKLGLEPPTKAKIFGRTDSLTQEQRGGLKKIQELKAAGDLEGAKKLRESLNLPKMGHHLLKWMNEDNSKEA